MSNCVVQVKASRCIPVPAIVARRFLHDIAHLAVYEPKVTAVTVTTASPTAGTYRARGWFLCFPWWGRFTYRITPHGFTSRMVEGPPLVSVSGGLRVSPVDGEACRVLHFERYSLPGWVAPFGMLLRAVLMTLLSRELANVERGIIGATRHASRRPSLADTSAPRRRARCSTG